MIRNVKTFQVGFSVCYLLIVIILKIPFQRYIYVTSSLWPKFKTNFFWHSCYSLKYLYRIMKVFLWKVTFTKCSLQTIMYLLLFLSISRSPGLGSLFWNLFPESPLTNCLLSDSTSTHIRWIMTMLHHTECILTVSEIAISWTLNFCRHNFRCKQYMRQLSGNRLQKKFSRPGICKIHPNKRKYIFLGILRNLSF